MYRIPSHFEIDHSFNLKLSPSLSLIWARGTASRESTVAPTARRAVDEVVVAVADWPPRMLACRLRTFSESQAGTASALGCRVG